MNEIDLIGSKWLKDRKRALLKNYIRLGLKASGQWGRTLRTRFQSDTSKMTLSGDAKSYTEYMQNGRRKNKKQSPEDLKRWVGWAGSTFLKKWVEDKGLSISPYAVAWKIAREGVKVPNKNNKGGLVTDVINEKEINKLIAALGRGYINQATSDIRNIFKKEK